MPIYEYVCEDCGKLSEILLSHTDESPDCPGCGGSNLKKLLSAHSAMSGVSKNSFPGPGDTACCGSSPAQAGCAGPGSCCGRAH